MRRCRVSCDISSQYLSHNTYGFKGEQNNKRVTKRFLSRFASWLIHASRMHLSHSVSSWSNPSALQASWNVRYFVSSTIWRCSKEVVHGTTISRRWRKKCSPAVGCKKYIHPTAFSPRCWANQTFTRMFQTWSARKSTYTTFRPSAFWTLYAK
jgi:hypothetical protein